MRIVLCAMTVLVILSCLIRGRWRHSPLSAVRTNVGLPWKICQFLFGFSF